MGAAKDEQNPADQLLDMFVYAPVGLALDAIDNFPKYVERGRSQITLGRFLARTVANKGSSAVESVADRIVSDAGQAIVDLFGIDLTPDPSTDADVETQPPPPDTAPDLPIAEYDSQAAVQIVKLLPQLSLAELDEIEAHENAGRGRVTILRKVAQLRDQG